VTIPHVYLAYHVNLDGTAEANYHLQVTDNESAIKEARQYLANHENIEVWNRSRSVARLTAMTLFGRLNQSYPRNSPQRVQSHLSTWPSMICCCSVLVRHATRSPAPWKERGAEGGRPRVERKEPPGQQAPSSCRTVGLITGRAASAARF
jgi:hypothetical protein